MKNPFELARQIMWRETLIVNAMRWAAGGIVWFFIALLFSLGGTMPVGQAFSFLLIPLVFPFALAGAYFAAWLSQKRVPFAGLVAFVLCLIPMCGDPLIFLLHTKRPDLLPVQEYGLINREAVIYVLKPMASARPERKTPANVF